MSKSYERFLLQPIVNPLLFHTEYLKKSAQLVGITKEGAKDIETNSVPKLVTTMPSF
jgi:hypothetical protein